MTLDCHRERIVCCVDEFPDIIVEDDDILRPVTHGGRSWIQNNTFYDGPAESLKGKRIRIELSDTTFESFLEDAVLDGMWLRDVRRHASGSEN